MFCPNCGAKLEPGTKVCVMCGYRIAGSDADEKKEVKKAEKKVKQEGENITVAQKPAGSKSKKRAGIIGGLCAAGGVAALLIVLFAVTGNNKNMTLEEQLESLQAKYETAKSREEEEKILKEAEEIQNKIEESIEAASRAEAESKLASIQASQEAEKKAESEQSTTESTTQTQAPAQTQPQATTTTIGSSLDEQQTIQAQVREPFPVYGEPAQVLTRSGNMLGDGQYDRYSFTAPYDGRYRAEMAGLPSGALVDLDFYDSGGKLLDSNYGIGNGDGVTVKDLVGGATYEVVVSYNNTSTPYMLLVGIQKPALDISNATVCYDSVEYTDQRNLYNFTPASTGDYRFEFADVPSGILLDMFAFDDPGNKLGSKEGIANGDGLTLKNLKAGQVYEIQVRQSKGLGSYSVLVK